MTRTTAWTQTRLDAGGSGISDTSDSPPSSRRAAWWLIGFTLVLFAYHVGSSRGFLGPGILDEAGYLGNARNLVDPTPVWSMGEQSFYRAAYSLFILPAELFQSVSGRYRLALAMNGLFLALLAPMLYMIARRVTGCRPGAAFAGAAVAATLPAILMWSKMAMSEALAVTGFTAAVGALWLTATDRSTWQRLTFGPVLAVLYGTHGRFLLVIVFGFVALVLLGWVQNAWKIPLANIISGAAGIVAFMVLHSHLATLRWDTVAYNGEPATSVQDVVGLITSASDLRALLSAVIGQGWYLVVSTFGLAAFGMAALLLRFPARVTGLRLALREDPSRMVAAFALLSCLGVAIASCLFAFRANSRPDFFIYGRYNEAFVPLLVALGIGALSRSGNRRTVLIGLATISAVLAAGLIDLVLIRDAERYSGTPRGWNTVNVFGIYPFIDAEARSGPDPDYRAVLQAITFGGLVGSLVVAGVARAAKGRRWGPVLLTVVCLAASLPVGRADLSFFGDYIKGLYGRLTLPAHLATMGSPRRIALDVREHRDLTAETVWHVYQYALPETEVLAFDSSTMEVPAVPVVLAPFEWEVAAAGGARLALTEPALGVGVWVMPGPLQEEMAKKGWLVPPNYQGRLPDPARKGAVEVLGGLSGLTINSGDTVTLKVLVHHLGEGAPWLAGPVDLKGRMVLSAAWRPPAGEPIDRRLGWAGLGELPHSLRPGESAEVEVAISAVTDNGDELPEGDYRLTFELHELLVSSLSTPATAPVTLPAHVIP